MVKWNPDILSKYVAPGISEFTGAEIPELAETFPEAPYWIANHFLNSVFRASFSGEYRQLIIGFIRRAQTSFFTYHRARDLTLYYLDGVDPFNPKLQQYYNAINEWERFALEIQMAIELFNTLNLGERAFKKGDNSKENRIYLIANHIKHTASCIKNGKVEDYHNIPLWMTNTGIHSFCDTVVSYQEAFEILRDISRIAEELHDPRGFKEKWKGNP